MVREVFLGLWRDRNIETPQLPETTIILMKAAAAHEDMQPRVLGWIVVVLAVSLSGCSGAQGDEPLADTGPHVSNSSPPGASEETADRAADGTWWDDVTVESYSPLNVCASNVCVVKQELAKTLSESELKVFAGWTAHSPMAKLYIHLYGDDVDRKMLEKVGFLKD